MIYLDNNSTTPLLKSVKKYIIENIDNYGNPSSVHMIGKKNWSMVENTRKSVGDFLNVDPSFVKFFSTATEANNFAIFGGGESKCIVSSFEHPSIKNFHKNTVVIDDDGNGKIDIKALEEELKNLNPGEAVVCLMLASNETGVVQPVKDVAKLCAKYFQRFHVDAVQGFGKMKINFNDIGCHSMSISGHKVGCMMGVGCLIYSDANNFEAHIKGGGQENGQRSGTHNVFAINSLSVGIGEIKNELNYFEKTKNLTKALEERIRKMENVEIVFDGVEKNGNTILLLHKNKSTQFLLMFYDLNKICVSAGSACSSGSISNPKYLDKLVLDGNSGIIRVSLGHETEQCDIDKFCEVLEGMYV